MECRQFMLRMLPRISERLFVKKRRLYNCFSDWHLLVNDHFSHSKNGTKKLKVEENVCYTFRFIIS